MTTNAQRAAYIESQDLDAESRDKSFDFFMTQMEEQGSAEYLTARGEDKHLVLDEFLPELIDDEMCSLIRKWWASGRQGNDLKRYQASESLQMAVTNLIESAVRVAVDEEHKL